MLGNRSHWRWSKDIFRRIFLSSASCLFLILAQSWAHLVTLTATRFVRVDSLARACTRCHARDIVEVIVHPSVFETLHLLASNFLKRLSVWNFDVTHIFLRSRLNKQLRWTTLLRKFTFFNSTPCFVLLLPWLDPLLQFAVLLSHLFQQIFVHFEHFSHLTSFPGQFICIPRLVLSFNFQATYSIEKSCLPGFDPICVLERVLNSLLKLEVFIDQFIHNLLLNLVLALINLVFNLLLKLQAHLAITAMVIPVWLLLLQESVYWTVLRLVTHVCFFKIVAFIPLITLSTYYGLRLVLNLL